MLLESKPLSVQEIVEKIEVEYLAFFETPKVIDESTIRKKLKEYEKIGLVYAQKHGKRLFYSRVEDTVDLENWKHAVSFFSEIDPIGVIGSYILDKLDEHPDYFSFKHHYILHALESEVMFTALTAIRRKAKIEIETFSRRREKATVQLITPIRIFVSVQNGRSYLASYHHRFKKVMLFRLDTIKRISIKSVDPNYDQNAGFVAKYKEFLWGVSAGMDLSLDHLEMTIRVEDGEEHIVNRLEREKRNGRLEMLDKHTYKYITDVYDAAEMLPWLRTFIGRIISLECSSAYVTETFIADLRQMESMYGVREDAI
ncbi:MAG: WYL domain-containing protein [Christensenellales bacterium]|jgi:hypothetical protein